MTNEITGTTVELYRLRHARKATAAALFYTQQAGLDTEPLQAALADLLETVVYIPVPCLICKREYPQPAEVAAENLPYAVLCEDCNAKVEAEVEALNEGKPKRRKRRTKAEMEAARAAEAEA